MRLKDATVLVVDDELHYRDIMKGWFEKEGARVFTAENGARGLELLQKNDVHAIVTDIRMPIMDGAEMIKQARARGKYTPAAVSVTGFSDLVPRDAYDLGIEAQLSKPVQRKALVAALSRTLTDREELWAGRFHDTTLPPLMIELDTLASALGEKRIAFGRGGFCAATAASFPEESSISFELAFAKEGRLVAGQGIVRWCAPKEKLVGIEVMRLSEPSRAWVASLGRSNQTVSFIPRST